MYLAGVTNSLTGISFNQPQSSFQGVQDGFVAKYNASGSLLWSRYIGGNNIDGIRGIDLDTSSNLFIYGLTKSNSGISTPNAFQQALSGTIDYDTYLLKLDENGVVLWGTYYGGPSIDVASQCVSDNFGNVYTVGTTNSTSGISNNGYQNSFGGGFDLFFAKFNGNGNQLWASYYGGNDVEDNPDLGIDSFGNLILVGGAVTQNINMVNPIQNGFNGGDNDAIIAKFDSACALTWSSYFEEMEMKETLLVQYLVQVLYILLAQLPLLRV
ncbi:MAG: SBBP repeat-containing protein [Bacteroidetes bacterium]|nr:SBBP repeat-containing protein [Bacteroidota bacterium]